jgi:hypothetical protein
MASLDSRITAPADEPVADWPEDNGQLDGAVAYDGNAMTEPEFDVEVKLIDANSPLYSVKSFEELGLSVMHLLLLCDSG